MSNLYPKWKECKNAIATGSSDLYAPYLAVYIKSILKNVSPNEKYDIVILESDISKNNKEKLLQTIEGYSNVALRFYNVDSLFNDINLPISSIYFSKHCYYRLAVGKVFSEYNKVLFTDIDLTVANGFNINNVFKIDIQEKPIAAVEEFLWSKENRKGKIQQGYDVDDYITNKVKCSDKYFNTGVMIVDIEKFNRATDFETLLQIALKEKFINQEQCTLNQAFDGQVYELPSVYNFEICKGIFNCIQENNIDYMQYIDNAKIYHFLTSQKVWFYPELPKADIWWSYARQTPFYEEILARMVDFRSSRHRGDITQLRNEFANTHFPNINNRFAANEYNTKLLFVSAHTTSLKFKKAYYGLRKAFAFGKRHKKYQTKYNNIKQLLKDARKFKRQMLKV